jgi:hypothetical protein
MIYYLINIIQYSITVVESTDSITEIEELCDKKCDDKMPFKLPSLSGSFLLFVRLFFLCLISCSLRFKLAEDRFFNTPRL